MCLFESNLCLRLIYFSWGRIGLSWGKLSPPLPTKGTSRTLFQAAYDLLVMNFFPPSCAAHLSQNHTYIFDLSPRRRRSPARDWFTATCVLRISRTWLKECMNVLEKNRWNIGRVSPALELWHSTYKQTHTLEIIISACMFVGTHTLSLFAAANKQFFFSLSWRKLSLAERRNLASGNIQFNFKCIFCLFYMQ